MQTITLFTALQPLYTFTAFSRTHKLSLTCVCVPFLLQLHAEVECLEELKMKNIQNVIESIRAEIEILWEKCFYSMDQRQALTAYYSGIPALTATS